MLLILALWLTAGICLNAAATHLFISIGRLREPTHLLFGFMCLLAAFVAICSAQTYRAESVANYLFWLRGGETASIVFFICMPWLVQGYTQARPRWPAYALSAAYFSVLVLELFSAYGIANAEPPTLVRVELWGHLISFLTSRLSPGIFYYWFVHCCLLVYFVAEAVQQFRDGRARHARALIASLGPFLLTMIVVMISTALRGRTYSIGTFGFVATVLMMGAALSRELRLRQERMQSVLDNVPMAIWVKDRELRYVFVNRFYERIFGYKFRHMEGRHDSQIFPAELRTEWAEMDRQVVESKQRLDIEQQLQLGRQLRTMSAVLFPLKDARDELYGLGGAATDITERKRTADAMHALAQPGSADDSREFFKNCARHLASTYGAQYAFILLYAEENQELRSIASWPVNDRPLFDRVPLNGSICATVLQEGRLYMERSVREAYPHDSQLQRIEAESFFAAPLIATSTRVIGVIGVASTQRLDMFATSTELLDAFAKRVAVELDRIAAVNALRTLASQLEVRVSERTRELQQLNRELEAFSYSVSHDLRGPLRAIDGYTSMLLESLDASLDERSRGHLKRVRDAVKRMADLIDDLLELAKVTQADLHAEQVDATTLAMQSLARLREEELERTVDLSVAPGMSLYADQRLLRVAIDNLLGNAWKYTSRTPHARIEVGMIDESQTAVFYVRDNGVGFDPAYADKLFQVFQRLHNSVNFPGTGVGLAIVARIIERHHGRVWAESEPERGATFFFSLPKAGGRKVT